jgi:ribA/ribD-fused uncharacterized protein
MTETINFYGRRMPYFEFSNFYRAPLTIDGKVWKTSEHYYQAMKFDGHPDHVEAVRQTDTPMKAANMGRERHRPLRQDWEEVKDSVMYDALMAKFTQHEKLNKLLLETGDAILVEHTKNDSYWGDGGDGSGKNMLGKLLMVLRDDLNK